MENARSLGARVLRDLADDRERDANRGTDNPDRDALLLQADLLREAADILQPSSVPA